MNYQPAAERLPPLAPQAMSDAQKRIVPEIAGGRRDGVPLPELLRPG